MTEQTELAHTINLRGRTLPRYIAIEGPIGVGKTTLAKRIAQTFNYEPQLEGSQQNPFLERFYQDRRQHALATQLFFLFERAKRAQEMRQTELFQNIQVTDFLVEKDRLFAQINLDPDEFQLYENVYQQLTLDTPQPDLVIYLQASTSRLLQRIERRGIPSERTITEAYLRQLNEVYSEFFLYYDAAPLLIVNANDIDLASNDKDYYQFIDYMLDIKSGRHYFNPIFFG